eukprot:scaffold29747_cov107-Isochrysis_galbana.AAC.4
MGGVNGDRNAEGKREEAERRWTAAADRRRFPSRGAGRLAALDCASLRPSCLHSWFTPAAQLAAASPGRSTRSGAAARRR